MDEKLLTRKETMKRFSMGSTSFHFHLPNLLANGLVRVHLAGGGLKFVASSVEQCISNLVDKTVCERIKKEREEDGVVD